MKIHSICLVKDEADVIVECLTSASEWSDFIYVYDNGSVDGTWEKVKDLASRIPCVIPFKQEHRPFADGLRREPFNAFRNGSKPGDWWCRLDADEFYIDPPRAFLSSVPSRFDTVWSASFQYYFTEKDAALFSEKPESYADEVPVNEKCKYCANNWSEPRFYRYSPSLIWESGNWPFPLRRSYHERIRLRHYQYRSPRQIEKRLAVRGSSPKIFAHEGNGAWNKPDQENVAGVQAAGVWRERIVDSSSLVFDSGDNYPIDPSRLPGIVDIHPTRFRRVVQKVKRRLAL